MSWLYTHCALPLIEPDRCSGLGGRLRAIRRFERMPEKAQRTEQEVRLQRLLQHAYHTVPFYRQQFDKAGFRASDARVDQPLPLPVLTRDDLRFSSYSLRSSAYKRENRRVAASSGATRAPIRFHRDVAGVRDKIALKITLDAWSGYEPGDSTLMLWGANSSPMRESNWRWRIHEGVFMRQSPLPRGVIAQDVLDRLRWRYEKQRPRVLYGLPSVLTAFAAYMQERGIRHRPQVVIATGEVLTGPDRRLLESAFHTIPFLYYGRRDVGMIAAECREHEGLHFHPWGSHVEFDPIGDSREGMVYRLLVTDLLNYAQPFIRYDTGDCVTLAQQKCSCGLWYPMVDQVVGRSSNGAIEPNGTVVPITALTQRTAPVKRAVRDITAPRIARRTAASDPMREEITGRSMSA